MRLDHIAILVEDIEQAAHDWDLPLTQPIEDFPAEGTRELYCGEDAVSGRVLLMQPIGPGPYARAMEKRGAGLHHVALAVDDIVDYTASLEGSGWYLHPSSLRHFESRRQAWLCRPGFPSLVELFEGSHEASSNFVTRLELAAPEDLAHMIARLGCDAIGRAPGDRHVLKFEGRQIELQWVW